MNRLKTYIFVFILLGAIPPAASGLAENENSFIWHVDQNGAYYIDISQRFNVDDFTLAVDHIIANGHQQLHGSRYSLQPYLVLADNNKKFAAAYPAAQLGAFALSEFRTDPVSCNTICIRGTGWRNRVAAYYYMERALDDESFRSSHLRALGLQADHIYLISYGQTKPLNIPAMLNEFEKTWLC